jgi:nitrogen regulatory protein PII
VTYLVIQAYVRPQLAARVIQALLDAGCDDLFLGEARRVVGGLQGPEFEYSVQLGQKVEVMTRLEVIGSAEEVKKWTSIIRDAGSSRRHGDGVVTVSEAVEHFHLSSSPHDAGRPPAERRNDLCAPRRSERPCCAG